MKKVPCITCGHPGTSQFPEHYQCTSCYYRARAEYTLRQADELELRVVRIRVQSSEFRQKAEKFEASGKWKPTKRRLPVGERRPGLWD